MHRQMIRELRLKPGLMLRGDQRGRHLGRVVSIEGRNPDEWAGKTALYDGTALDPQPMMKLEHNPTEFTTRIIDILCPGRIRPARPDRRPAAHRQNHPPAKHRPRHPCTIIPMCNWSFCWSTSGPKKSPTCAAMSPARSTPPVNDNTVDKHLDLAQLVIERCKRQVEFGADIVVLLDSLTRLGRAFNTGGPSGGRTMSGGLDNRALEIPKRLFGAARKIENGGSLTILATCLIDTGSRMDQVIFEEFKGTGNMELTLDRNLANQRIWPALDIAASGTRKEELLLPARDLAAARSIRRMLMNMNPTQAIKTLLEILGKQKTNADLLNNVRV